MNRKSIYAIILAISSVTILNYAAQKEFTIEEYNSIFHENNLELLNSKLRDGLDPDFLFFNNEKSRLIHAAILEDKIDILKLLLKAKADPNILDAQYFTPLHHAVHYKDDTEFAKVLLENKANPNINSNYLGTPLHNAVTAEHNETIKLLLRQGADINITNRKNQTPMELQARWKTIITDDNNLPALQAEIFKDVLRSDLAKDHLEKTTQLPAELLNIIEEYTIGDISENIIRGVRNKKRKNCTIL